MSSVSPVTITTAAPTGPPATPQPQRATKPEPLPNQQLNLSAYPQPSLGNTIFPPTSSTLAGTDAPPLARFGASFLSTVLPTNQAPVVSSPIGQAPTTNPAIPVAPGQNSFTATYAPQIYAVFVNGLIGQAGLAANTILIARNSLDIASPPILGDPPPLIGGLPPTAPNPEPVSTGGDDQGDDQVVAALQSLAGSGSIFPAGASPAPAPAEAAPTPEPAAASTPSPAPAKAAAIA